MSLKRYKKAKTMSTENTTYAFQVAATTGVGLTQFFSEATLRLVPSVSDSVIGTLPLTTPTNARPVCQSADCSGKAVARIGIWLLHGDVECGVDGDVELVECAANMDRMASGPERCQHQVDPGIDGE